MGDVGEGFRELRMYSIKRRGENRDNGPKILDEKGISYESKNGGAHLIVEGSNGKIDFWPGTGKFIARGGGKGRGIFNLIKRCREKI